MIPQFFNDFKVLINVAIIIALTFLINYIVNRIIKKFITNKLAEKDSDVTSYKFLQHFATTVIFIFGIGVALYTVPAFESIGQTILASAGVLSLVVGVASQQSIGNIVSGVFIVLYKPFRINDKIQIEDKVGRVEDINMRHVILRDLENNRIIIPNSLINTQIIVNSHLEDARCCKRIEIGIGYHSDIDKALEIMQKEIANHPFFVDNRTDAEKLQNFPLVKAKVIALADSAVTIRAWAWANNADDCFDLYCDVLKSSKQAFERHGIDIPFPQRVVTLKN